MRKFMILASMAVLAACSANSEEPAAPVAETASTAEPATAEQGVPPGTYDVKSAEGAMGSTQINADGTYVDTDAEGAEVKGTYARRDDKDCFDPEGDSGAICWSVGPTNADGSFDATSPDGKTTVTVTPQAR